MGLTSKAAALATLALTIAAYQNCSAPFSVASLDSATNASGLSDATPPPKTGKVDVVMASGHMGRTVYSCDDGKTWINDLSNDNSARCWVDQSDPHYVECDHNEGAGHGLDYYNGAYYANFGWGYNGGLRKSTDGVHWKWLRQDGWGPGVATSRGKIFLMWGYWKTSDDDGVTWKESNEPLAAQLDHPNLQHIGDKLFSGSANGVVAMSKDDGATWTQLQGWDPKFGRTFAEGNGVIVSIGGTDPNTSPTTTWAARSTDGGVTWTGTQVANENGLSWYGLQFNGTQFIAWGGGRAWKSSDGVTWTSTPVILSSADTGLWNFNGAFTYIPSTGTYILLTSNWGAYYSAQKALRSKDGVHWDILDAQHFTGGHPISYVVPGQLDASACP